jgi:hypothetical protein
MTLTELTAFQALLVDLRDSIPRSTKAWEVVEDQLQGTIALQLILEGEAYAIS